MNKFLLAILFLVIICQFAWADLEVALAPINKFNQEGHSVPLQLIIKNNGTKPVEIPQYLVPFFDFDLKVFAPGNKELNRTYSVFNLAFLKPTGKQVLKPNEEYVQRINDLGELYPARKVGVYQVQAFFYPEREKIAALSSNIIDLAIGNVAGDQGYLIFSDTAYIQKGFNFTAVYPNGNYLIREYSNNYFILGARSSWLQAGWGYSDGPYVGLKWQVLAEKDWWPALGAQFMQWKAGREIMTSERKILGYWVEDRGTSYMASKRLPYRAHIHFGVKRYEVASKLEAEEPGNTLYLFNMFALDQSYDFGMLMFEVDYDNVHHIKSEAFMYKGLPSWEPQVGVGLLRYRPDFGREYTMFFFALSFNTDNHLLGYKF